MPTSKVKLFVIIGFCKVIFCRLMVLYTHYCPMSVFFISQLVTGSIPFQVVPHANIWDAALCDNGLYYCILLAMILHAQFLPMNFLVIVSVLCRVHFVPDYSNLFRVVPAHSRSFQLVSGGSMRFRLWVLLNPFRTAKPPTNGNHRLKSKPQVKCHWTLPSRLTLEGEARARRSINSGHSPQAPPQPWKRLSHPELVHRPP